MATSNANLVNRMRQALYTLKREYGARIDFYKLVSSDTNPQNGERSVVTNVTTIWRCPVLPAKVKRVAQAGISLISSNKEFVTGGTYDQSARDFIFDRRDCPNLAEPTADDWIVFNNRKYQVETVEVFEYDCGWVITGRELVGEIPAQTISMSVIDYVELDDSVTSSS